MSQVDQKTFDMEEICKRFPLLVEKILKNLDYQSLIRCKEVGLSMCKVLDNGRVLWKQSILNKIKGNLTTLELP